MVVMVLFETHVVCATPLLQSVYGYAEGLVASCCTAASMLTLMTTQLV